MSFELPPAEDLAFSTYALERLKVTAQGRVGAHVIAQTEMETWMSHMTDHLCVRLVSEVLAERVLDTDVSVDWRGDVDLPVDGYQPRGQGWPLLAGALLALLTPLVGLSALIGAMVLAVIGVALLALNPPRADRTDKVAVSGTVTVPATYWRKFPEIDHVYPKSFGAPIQYSVLGTPYWHPDGGEPQ